MEASISESEAITIAEDMGDSCIEQIELQYVDPEKYNKDFDNASHTAYLAYMIETDEGIEIIVNAMDGSVIGVDEELSEEGRCYALKESSDPNAYNYREYSGSIATLNQYRLDNIALAKKALARLGCNVTLSKAYSTSSLATSIKNYAKGKNSEYALYFSGHGSKSSIGFKKHSVLTSSDVSGNWHFVFLDACSTAATTGWANAFHINGYTNRAYLGWYQTVKISNSHEFSSYFWSLLKGKRTVRQAALSAASSVPGSGTTPIRFYGDTSYTGKAWN